MGSLHQLADVCVPSYQRPCPPSFIIFFIQPDLRILNVTCNHLYVPEITFSNPKCSPTKSVYLSCTLLILSCHHEDSLSQLTSIISRLLLNIRREKLQPPPPNRSEGSTSRSTTANFPEVSTLTTGFSTDLMSAVIGNIGEDFEEGSSAGASSVRSQTVTYESEAPDESMVGSGSGHNAIEMIEVSELRMERERVIGWDQIWAAGING